MKTNTFTLVIFIALVAFSGCESKQEVAQEQSKEALKKMYSREPVYRSYDQIQKDNREKEEKGRKTAQQLNNAKGE